MEGVFFSPKVGGWGGLGVFFSLFGGGVTTSGGFFHHFGFFSPPFYQ